MRRASPTRSTTTRWSRSTSSIRSAKTGSPRNASRAVSSATVADACLEAFDGRAGRASDRAALEPARAAAGRTSHRAIADLRADGLDSSTRTPAAGSIRVDPSLARGLSYYTGAIMEIAVPDLAGKPWRRRALRQPGRHVPRTRRARLRLLARSRAHHRRDDRAEHVSGEVVARRRGRDGRRAATTSLRADALGWPRSCRAEKLRVDVYPDAGSKLDKPLKYASSRNVPVLAIVGEDERRARGSGGQGSADAAAGRTRPRAERRAVDCRTLRSAESEPVN